MGGNSKFKRNECLSYIDSTDELIKSIEKFLIAEKYSIDEIQNKFALLNFYDNKKPDLDCYIKNKFGLYYHKVLIKKTFNLTLAFFCGVQTLFQT